MAKAVPLNAPQAGHRSVTDMVRDLLTDDPEFVNEFETRLSNRQLVKALAVIRARAGLSQQELAAKVGCSQSKISKLESGNDADLRFGDIAAYLQATNHEARIFLVAGGGSLVDEVKMHAYQIKQLLDRLIELAGTDGAMTKGVATFIEEAAFNLTRITKMAVDAVPKLPPEPSRPVHIETPDPENGTAANPPTRSSRRKTAPSSKAASAAT